MNRSLSIPQRRQTFLRRLEVRGNLQHLLVHHRRLVRASLLLVDLPHMVVGPPCLRSQFQRFQEFGFGPGRVFIPFVNGDTQPDVRPGVFGVETNCPLKLGNVLVGVGFLPTLVSSPHSELS